MKKLIFNEIKLDLELIYESITKGILNWIQYGSEDLTTENEDGICLLMISKSDCFYFSTKNLPFGTNHYF